MRLIAAFTTEDNAWEVAETLPGVMGYMPPEGWRALYDKQHYADVMVEPLVVLTSVTDFLLKERSRLVESAKSKLSPAEWEAVKQFVTLKM